MCRFAECAASQNVLLRRMCRFAECAASQNVPSLRSGM